MPLSADEIVDQIVTFVVAGVEATATTLAWTLHELATHPDLQRRVYALGAAWQLAQRAEGTAPALEQYTALRLSSIGAKPITALYPSLNGYRLDDSEAMSPPVRAATEMAWLPSAWDNDLYSWQTDVSEGATHTNLVGIIVNQQRLDHHSVRSRSMLSA